MLNLLHRYWIRITFLKFLNDLSIDCNTTVGIDNQGAMKLAQNPVFHERSKHIDIRYHFIRDEISSGHIKLVYVPTHENYADIFTKPVIHSKLSDQSTIAKDSIV